MNRFSITMTDEELKMLEQLRTWYERETGVRVSRCSIIKRLLFDQSPKTLIFRSGLKNILQKGSKSRSGMSTPRFELG